MLLTQFVETSYLAEADLALLLVHAFFIKLANDRVDKLGGPEGVALVAATVFLKPSIVLHNYVAVALALCLSLLNHFVCAIAVKDGGLYVVADWLASFDLCEPDSHNPDQLASRALQVGGELFRGIACASLCHCAGLRAG